VTIGNFDGVHRGHRELIEAAARAARDVGGPAVAVTFDPPPAALLYPQPEKATPLTTLRDRSALLHAAGVDHVVILKTDAGLLSLSPEAFFEEVITRVFAAKAVVEGYNFHFGRGRTGDTRLLRSLCESAGIRFVEVAPVTVSGAPVSSSRIRRLLHDGEVAAAAELFGRWYSLRGIVVPGARRGRTIGFPTANLEEVMTVIPGPGVYAVRARIDRASQVGEAWMPAAANIGPNPTFGDTARKLEVHLLDYAGDLYGQTLRIEFVARLRDIRTFAGVEELVEQLRVDIAQTRAILRQQ
jgi:riboflavin kinase/FMN adenylyltransferase